MWEYGFLGHINYDLYMIRMRDVGSYFLSHKMVVRRKKLRRKREANRRWKTQKN